MLVVIPGHLSTSPRLLKAADACAAAGHQVTVLSGSFMQWAAEADEVTARMRPWRWRRIEYRRAVRVGSYARTGARRRVARALAQLCGAAMAPRWAISRSLSRAHDELRREALREPSDLVLGGSVGGLALVPEIAAALGARCVLDLEDLHTAESAEGESLQDALSTRALTEAFHSADALTTSSQPMADAYEQQFARRPLVIHNVFPFPPASRPRRSRDERLRLYWFSQSIGPGRGLEEAIYAAGRSGVPITLTMRGHARAEYLQDLRALRARAAPALQLVDLPPVPPDEMLATCADHVVGLSGDTPEILNRQLCLCNKTFSYLLMGLPVLLSDTAAHRWLAARIGRAALVYRQGDVDSLAAHLRVLQRDAHALNEASDTASRVARERWHWEHPAERGAFLGVVQQALA